MGPSGGGTRWGPPLYQAGWTGPPGQQYGQVNTRPQQAQNWGVQRPAQPQGAQTQMRPWQPQQAGNYPRNAASNAWAAHLQTVPGNSSYQQPGNRQQHLSQPQQQHQHPVAPPRQHHNSAPEGRDNGTTEWLHKNLMGVFPENLDMVNRILQNHPKETNLNELSSFILEALTKD